MADQEQLDVVVTLRDEASDTANKVRAAMARLKADSKTSAVESREHFKGLESVVSGVFREVGTGIRLLGVQGAFVSGGFVASITAMAVALGNFARSSLSLRYTAQEVELTVNQFNKFSYAMRSKGLTEEQATASTNQFAKALLNLRRGQESDVWKKLETSTSGGTGAVWAQQVEHMLETDGLPRTMKWVANFINTKFKGNKEDRFAAEALRNALGISQAALDGVADNLDEFGHAIEPDEKAALGFIKALVKLQIETDNLKNKVGIALLPTFTKLADMFSEWISGDKGKAFVKRIEEMVAALLEMDWDAIRQVITTALAGIGKELKNFVKDVAAAVASLDEIVKIVNNWKTGNDASRARGEKPGTLLFGDHTPQKFDSNIPGMPTITPNIFDNLERPLTPEFKKWQRENVEGLSGEASSNIEDRRNDPSYDPTISEGVRPKMEQRRSKQYLRQQTEGMTIELQRLVDVFRDMRGGAGGGSSDGGVSKSNRSPSSGVGGSGGAPFGQSLNAQELREIGLSQLRSGMLMQLMSVNPVAEGDSDPTAPGYIGSTKDSPTYYGGRQLIDRSNDSGMVIRNPGRGSNTGSMGYGDGQRGAVNSAINGWSGGDSPTGSLSLDVNVKGPRGTKVDAGVTDGDFIPADRGININREMTQ